MTRASTTALSSAQRLAAWVSRKRKGGVVICSLTWAASSHSAELVQIMGDCSANGRKKITVLKQGKDVGSLNEIILNTSKLPVNNICLLSNRIIYWKIRLFEWFIIVCDVKVAIFRPQWHHPCLTMLSPVMRRLHSQISTQEFDEDKSSTLSDGLSSPPPHSGCSPFPSAGGCKTAQEHGSIHHQRSSTHRALSSSYSGGESGISSPAPVPLFLHLTCTLRCPGIEPVTTPMASLPTCLRKST